MLVVSRQRDESIMIGDDIIITIVDIRGDKVRLGVEAPKEVPVHRLEVYDAIRRHECREQLESTPEPNLEITTKLDDSLSNLGLTSASDTFPNLHNGPYRTPEEHQATLDQLRQEIARLQTDRANIIHDHDGEICSLQIQINDLQDEINDLLDCKEHLRKLGQEICGCEHVESSDERVQQTNHILDTYYQLGIHEPDPSVIDFCHKHQVVHTNGCYICQAEKE